MSLSNILNGQLSANIFNLAVGDDFLDNLEERVGKLLQNSAVINVLDDKLTSDSTVEEFCKILRSLKLILELLEWSLQQNRIVSCTSTVESVLQCIRDVIDKRPNDSTCLVCLEVLHILCRISALQNDAIPSLSKFYLYNMHLVQHSPGEEDLRFRLRVLNTVLEALHNATDKDAPRIFCDECRNCNSSVTDSELFTRLIVAEADAISAQALITVLPFYVKLFETFSMFQTIWNEALRIDKADEAKELKKFTIMCYIFEVFADNKTSEGVDAFLKVLEDERFWEVVLHGLTHFQQVIRKQSLYLLKRSLQEMDQRELTLVSHKLNEISAINFTQKLDDGVIKLNNGLKNFTVCDSKMFIVSNDTDSVMWWLPAIASELTALFADIFLVLETLEEKQSHIVKPVFNTMKRILGAAVSPFRNGKCLHASWILVLLERMLQHDSITVIRWALVKLMEVDLVLPKNEAFSSKLIHLLLHHLRNPAVFSCETESLRQELECYHKLVANSLSAKCYFQKVVEEICTAKWSPEPLYLVLSSFKGIKVHAWETKHILPLKEFVTTSIATHYTFFRSAIQCEMLSAIMNLIDVSNVSLETLTEVFGSFRKQESLQRGSKIWKEVASWVEFCFSKRSAEEFILENLPYKSTCTINSSNVCRMVCLLYDAHLFGVNKCCGEAPSPRIISLFKELLGSFKDADKRLYAAHDGLTYNLGVLCNIMEENLVGEVSEQSHLLEIMIPYFSCILGYIEFRSRSLHSSDDYEAAQVMVGTVLNILRVHQVFSINSESSTKSILNYSLRALGIMNAESKSTSAIENYACMNYLMLILDYVYHEKTVPHLKLLKAYFKRYINVTLPKPEAEGPTSTWGRVNEDYLVAQWKVAWRLRNENLLTVGATVNVAQFLSTDELVEHCLMALQMGGGNLLPPIMAVAEELLPELKADIVDRLVGGCWTAVMETRRNDAFSTTARRFIVMLYQPELIKKESCHGILLKYSFDLLSETANGLANAFLTHIQKLGVKYSPSPLWCPILAEALVFGPVPRREDRLTVEVCNLISASPSSANELVPNEWNTGSEVRARAIQIILTLSPGAHMSFADKVADALVNKEVSAVAGKTRYFSGSMVHFVRTRILQALLVLEPLLSKERGVMLYQWVCNSLMKESHQPSVRYFAEWLIIRIMWRNPDLQDSLWLYFNEALEQRVGSLCSFISVVYHTMCTLPDPVLEGWMDRAMQLFLPYCLAQHFSLRLYAQVTLGKMWALAEMRGIHGILHKYQIVRDCLARSVGNGNALKNAEKLKEDFYWTVFHPLHQFSLQTVFRDLPRLAHLKAEEWIAPELFSKVGVTPSGLMTIPWSSGNDLWHHPLATWSVRSEEESLEVPSDNLQKKMIPVKSLLPDYEESLGLSPSAVSRKKLANTDGLIVVASLVDRLPNLGGLSRTCEVFGVSELVLDSLSCLEDKAFQSLAVTASKWITLREIKSHHLSDYLLHMKREGYMVIGAEQTSKSIQLHDAKFPRKSLLLLGSEKEGIPPQLLPILDMCVEIPQLGVIRSLNVHVAGALFVWEYAKQHSLEQRPML